MPKCIEQRTIKGNADNRTIHVDAVADTVATAAKTIKKAVNNPGS